MCCSSLLLSTTSCVTSHLAWHNCFAGFVWRQSNNGSKQSKRATRFSLLCQFFLSLLLFCHKCIFQTLLDDKIRRKQAPSSKSLVSNICHHVRHRVSRYNLYCKSYTSGNLTAFVCEDRCVTRWSAPIRCIQLCGYTWYYKSNLLSKFWFDEVDVNSLELSAFWNPTKAMSAI